MRWRKSSTRRRRLHDDPLRRCLLGFQYTTKARSRAIYEYEISFARRCGTRYVLCRAKLAHYSSTHTIRAHSACSCFTVRCTASLRVTGSEIGLNFGPLTQAGCQHNHTLYALLSARMSPLGQLTTVVVACLACLSGTASAQSSSSTAVGAASSAGSVSASAISTALAPGTSTTSAANATEQAPGNVTVEGMVPAFANSTESALNATIQAVWSTDTARGTLT